MRPESHLSPVPVLVNVYGSDDRSAPTLHAAEEPLLYADDLAAVRGDGVFETLLVRDGRACNLDRHRRRFLGSAEMLELPEPDLRVWEAATELALSTWGVDREGAMRWVYSRGRESTGQPTGYILVMPLSAGQVAGRGAGLKVLTAEKGYSVDLGNRAPWALVGAKTLSYAANMAALRYAHERGCDDVIFVSSEGTVLEGPTSTVVAVRGRTLLTPRPGEGILAGTTQAALFELAQGRGWECVESALTTTDLIQADGVWLVSSVRLAAWVAEIDGHPLARPGCADEVEQLTLDALTA